MNWWAALGLLLLVGPLHVISVNDAPKVNNGTVPSMPGAAATKTGQAPLDSSTLVGNLEGTNNPSTTSGDKDLKDSNKPFGIVTAKLYFSNATAVEGQRCACDALAANVDGFKGAVQNQLQKQYEPYLWDVKADAYGQFCNGQPTGAPDPSCQGHLYLKITFTKGEKDPKKPLTDFNTRDYVGNFNRNLSTLCTFLVNNPGCDPLFNSIPWLTRPSSFNISGCAAEGIKENAAMDKQCSQEANPEGQPKPPPPPVAPPPPPVPPTSPPVEPFNLTWKLSAPKDPQVCTCIEDTNPVINRVAEEMKTDLRNVFSQEFDVTPDLPATCNNVVAECWEKVRYNVSISRPDGRRRLAQADSTQPAPPSQQLGLSLNDTIRKFQEDIAAEPGQLCVLLPLACKALFTNNFFNEVQGCTDPTKCPSVPPPNPHSEDWKIAVPVVLGVVLLALAVGLGVFFCCRHKRRGGGKHKQVLATHHTNSKDMGMVQQPSSSRVAGGGHVVNVGKVHDDAIGVAYNAYAPPRNAAPAIVASATTTKLMSAPMEHAAPGNYTVGYTTLEMEQELVSLETAVNTLVATLSREQVEAMLSSPTMPPQLLHICRTSYTTDRGLYEYAVSHAILLWCSKTLWLPSDQLVSSNSWLLAALHQCQVDGNAAVLSAAARTALSRWNPGLPVVKVGAKHMAGELLPQLQGANQGEILADVQCVVEAAMRCQLMALCLSPNMQLQVSGFGSTKGVALLDTRMQFVRRYAGFKASQASSSDVDPMGVAVSQKMNSHMTPTEVLLCCRPGVIWAPPQGSSDNITMVKEEEVITSEQGW